MTTPPDAPSALLAQIQAAIRGVRYGSVEITIHDGQVVQIEKREKVRLDVQRADRTTGGIPTTGRGQRPGGTS